MSVNPFEGGMEKGPEFEEGKEETGEEGADKSAGEASERRAGREWWDSVAERLLERRLLLTALELHLELSESGAELRRLRDFFSNPAHFESCQEVVSPGGLGSGLGVGGLGPRSASALTLESLDDRLSDDLDGPAGPSSRAALLEFQLRSARQTIGSLREQLAQPPAPGAVADASAQGPSSDEEQPARPHELRSLDFLVNEYLLQCGQRMTAVTFSEEVSGRNLEDWDEVGLSAPRPPPLLSLLRRPPAPSGQGLSVSTQTQDTLPPSSTAEAECQTETMAEAGAVEKVERLESDESGAGAEEAEVPSGCLMRLEGGELVEAVRRLVTPSAFVQPPPLLAKVHSLTSTLSPAMSHMQSSTTQRTLPE